MMFFRGLFLFFINLSLFFNLFSELNKVTCHQKIEEIVSAHFSYYDVNEVLVGRALSNFIEFLDPEKVYFLKGEVEEFLSPDQTDLKEALKDYWEGDFTLFEKIYDMMEASISRYHKLLIEVPFEVAEQPCSDDEEWPVDVIELRSKIATQSHLRELLMKALEIEERSLALNGIIKRQAEYEDSLFGDDSEGCQQFFYTHVIKSFASACDSHTHYFTPSEAKQFMIDVQQRLFGIGVQLKDDFDGFEIVNIIEGGPASREGSLGLGNKIIAINGSSVVGLNLYDAVGMIRGSRGESVRIAALQKDGVGFNRIEVDIICDEIILEESRLSSQVVPYGNGVIALLKLHSFYQDPNYSSAEDILKVLEDIKCKEKLEGVVLDLRNNSGGMLSQAIDVSGLFVPEGVIVSIKDSSRKINHFRSFPGDYYWSGPLVVLVNRLSASASEIVAQVMKDYDRAIIVGDRATYGKGSFQFFTMDSNQEADIDELGEYAVTKGIYYTASGCSPQLTGVLSDVLVPGGLDSLKIGEEYSRYPIASGKIKGSNELFFGHCSRIVASLQKKNSSKQYSKCSPYLERLVKNSRIRMKNDVQYCEFINRLNDNDLSGIEEQLYNRDYQSEEAINLAKDLIFLNQGR